MKRYSKKRESILNCIANTKEHPNAEWVYNQLKPEYPSLSLATVYRNISELIADGKVKSVCVINDKEKFDGNTMPHMHAVCSVCGKILDIENVSVPNELLKKAERETEFEVSYSNIQLIGVCKDCREKESEQRDEK
ncbi:MAG: transcriptional repressor [Clostridia bacterium]|nr:transcriptional repressor [Clostridia bacterium]